MGVFGLQLVVTMVMASVLSKVIPHWSPAQWLLCRTGLRFFLHPTDAQLGGNKKKGGHKSAAKKAGDEDDGSFVVLPKYLDIKLEDAPVGTLEVSQLRFFTDYQWLLDFSFCCALVYIITEVYVYYITPLDEVNLAMIWCALLLAFVLKTLVSVTLVYFKSRAQDGEKALVVLALFCYLLLAMVVLVLSEQTLELGLDAAYTTFSEAAADFMKAQGFSGGGVMSRLSCRAVVAVAGAMLGACLAFPGLRLGKMHADAVRNNVDRRWTWMLLHVSFIAPAVVVLLWVRPLARHLFVVHVWPRYDAPLLSSETFDMARVVCVLVVCALRLSVLPLYLQAYLGMARDKLQEQRSHAGKITNKQIQMQVAGIFYYLVVVTLQYLLPLLLISTLALMLKTLGGLHWLSLANPRGFVSAECDADDAPPLPPPDLAAVTHTSEAVTLGFEHLRKMLGPEWWHGVLGFWLWWSIFTWFVSGLFGLLYQKYFTRD